MHGSVNDNIYTRIEINKTHTDKNKDMCTEGHVIVFQVVVNYQHQLKEI